MSPDHGSVTRRCRRRRHVAESAAQTRRREVGVKLQCYSGGESCVNLSQGHTQADCAAYTGPFYAAIGRRLAAALAEASRPSALAIMMDWGQVWALWGHWADWHGGPVAA